MPPRNGPSIVGLLRCWDRLHANRQFYVILRVRSQIGALFHV